MKGSSDTGPAPDETSSAGQADTTGGSNDAGDNQEGDAERLTQTGPAEPSDTSSSGAIHPEQSGEAGGHDPADPSNPANTVAEDDSPLAAVVDDRDGPFVAVDGSVWDADGLVVTPSDPEEASALAELMNESALDWRERVVSTDIAEGGVGNPVVLLSYGEEIAEVSGVLALPERVFAVMLEARELNRTTVGWASPLERQAGRYHVTAVNRGDTVRLVCLENHQGANARHQAALLLQQGAAATVEAEIAGINTAIDNLARDVRPMLAQAGYGRKQWTRTNPETGEPETVADPNEMDESSPDMVRWWETLAELSETVTDPQKKQLHEAQLSEFLRHDDAREDAKARLATVQAEIAKLSQGPVVRRLVLDMAHNGVTGQNWIRLTEVA